MPRNRTQTFADRDEIIVYWFLTLKKKKKIKLLADIQDRCFACLTHTPHLDRAHIIPFCEGGSNEASNLHLLCRICHKESELLSGAQYDAWFDHMSPEKRRAIEYLKYHSDKNTNKVVRLLGDLDASHTASQESFDRAHERRKKEIGSMQNNANMGRPSIPITQETINAVHEMRRKRIPIKTIAKQLGYGVGTTYKIMEKKEVLSEAQISKIRREEIDIALTKSKEALQNIMDGCESV